MVNTTALATTADQIVPANALGASASEFTTIYNNYETTANFTTSSVNRQLRLIVLYRSSNILVVSAIVVTDGAKSNQGIYS